MDDCYKCYFTKILDTSVSKWIKVRRGRTFLLNFNWASDNISTPSLIIERKTLPLATTELTVLILSIIIVTVDTIFYSAELVSLDIIKWKMNSSWKFNILHVFNDCLQNRFLTTSLFTFSSTIGYNKKLTSSTKVYANIDLGQTEVLNRKS